MFKVSKDYSLVPCFELHISTLKNKTVKIPFERYEEINLSGGNMKCSIVVNKDKNGIDLKPYWLHTKKFKYYSDFKKATHHLKKYSYPRFKLEYKLIRKGSGTEVLFVEGYEEFIKEFQILGYEIHAKNRASLEPPIKNSHVSQVGPTQYFSLFFKATEHATKKELLDILNNTISPEADDFYLEAVIEDTNTGFEKEWLGA